MPPIEYMETLKQLFTININGNNDIFNIEFINNKYPQTIYKLNTISKELLIESLKNTSIIDDASLSLEDDKLLTYSNETIKMVEALSVIGSVLYKKIFKNIHSSTNINKGV
jgi:hypothetical protein